MKATMPRKTLKNVVEVKSVARSFTTLAMNTLAGVARSPRAPAAARVTAAIALLDRGWGKPDQAHVGADGGDIVVQIRHIVESVGEIGSAPRIIDHIPGEPAE